MPQGLTRPPVRREEDSAVVLLPAGKQATIEA
jgi:hypothetical protein